MEWEHAKGRTNGERQDQRDGWQSSVGDQAGRIVRGGLSPVVFASVQETMLQRPVLREIPPAVILRDCVRVARPGAGKTPAGVERVDPHRLTGGLGFEFATPTMIFGDHFFGAHRKAPGRRWPEGSPDPGGHPEGKECLSKMGDLTHVGGERGQGVGRSTLGLFPPYGCKSSLSRLEGPSFPHFVPRSPRALRAAQQFAVNIGYLLQVLAHTVIAFNAASHLLELIGGHRGARSV